MPDSASRLSDNGDAFRRALHRWFSREGRELPWRTERTVYRTVVSELMCQQTQIATVLPYFDRWMTRLPDFKTLAEAPEETVLRLWEGLGYYSRARNLHRLARTVAERGEPDTAAGWQKLPGIGPYTASAIASIEFAEPVACVDGNVIRILSRLTADDRIFKDGATAVKSLAPLAASLVPQSRPGLHNEAMMELGATVCLRQNPLCTVCPVLKFCEGSRIGVAAELPRIAPKKTEKREVNRLWVEKDGRLLLHRIPKNARRMANLYELPEAHQLGISSEKIAEGSLILTRKRAITRFQITERIYRPGESVANSTQKAPGEDLFWISVDKLGEIALSGPHRRWVSEILNTTRQAPDGKSSVKDRRASR